MPKILEYMPIPDDKIKQFKSLIKKTHGDPEWLKEHAKRTGINSIDAFFCRVTNWNSYDCCSRPC